jgi:hypothetical protein
VTSVCFILAVACLITSAIYAAASEWLRSVSMLLTAAAFVVNAHAFHRRANAPHP